MTKEERELAYKIQDPLLCLESPMERLIYDVLKTAGICPVMQYPIGKYWIDFALPEYRIAIEYDGEHHKTRVESDERRDDSLLNLGWATWRITKEDLKHFRDEEGNDRMKIEETIEKFRKALKAGEFPTY